MRIAPVSLNNSRQQAFGLLKFELDKPSKELYYNLCSNRPYASTESVHSEITALKKSMDDMDEEAEQNVQRFLNCDPVTRPLVAREVWPEERPVVISVKHVKTSDDENLLATLDGELPRTATEFFALDKNVTHLDFRRFLYRLVRDPYITTEFVKPEIESKPLYLEALEKQARLDSLDPEVKEKELRNDINEWIG